MYIRKISKHGNSLSVSIPATICRELKLYRGDFLMGKIDEDENIVLGKVADEYREKLLFQQADEKRTLNK